MQNAVICVLVNKRTEDAPTLQKVLTENGCIIKTRIGMHEVSDNCADDGLIILHLSGQKEDICKLEEEINKLDSVRAKKLELNF